MWTQENRARYDRSGLRYPSDLTDEEWAIIGPLIPLAKRGGNKRKVDVRTVVNGVMYILSTGCQWRALPKDLPPRSTVNVREVVNGLMYVLSTGCQWRYVPKDLPPRSTLHDYLDRWSYDGTLAQIHHALYVMCREQVAREASPSACVIDSQSVKGAEKGGAASIRPASMRARRSRARSATSWSTRKAC